MKINYENLKRLVEKIPLPIESNMVYEDPNFSILDEHNLLLEINKRSYEIKPIYSQENKAFGFLSHDGKPGSILFHYNSSVKEQRSWILHELAELELRALGTDKDKAHNTAREFEQRYLSEN